MKQRQHAFSRGFGVALGGIAFFASVPAVAAILKVGPTQQYKQLTAVVNLVKPGDIVEVDGNATYNGGAWFQVNGTAAAKITIRGITIAGKRPVISGGTNTIEAAGDHYVFENLEITGGSFRCFYHHAHDVTLRGSVIHDCPKHGLLGADSDSGSLLLEYTEVYKCGGGTFDHQIYMATDETAHPKSVFRMQHCYVHDANGGNSVKSRAERNEIYYNWIQGAMYHELELIGPDGQNEALAREDSDVVGNVLVKTATSYVVRFGGDGTGQTYGRYRFVNNTVITQPGGSAVFRLFDGIESVEMHNNVFTVSGSGGVNVLRTTEADWSTGGALIAGTKNWVKTGSTNLPAQWTTTTTGADPGFMNQSSLDVTLVGSSPIINQGATSTSGPPGYAFPNPLAAPQYHPPLHTLQALGSGQARPIVGVIDPGAFEYGSGSGSGGSGGTGGSGTGGTSSGGSSSGGSSSGGTSAGGASSGGSNSGGTAGAGGGSAGVAGMAGASSGGTSAGGSSSGGASSGGASSGGSASGGKGGSTGKGGSGGATGTGASGGDSEDDGGCGCRTVPAEGGSFGWLVSLLALVGLSRAGGRRGARANARRG